MLRPYHHGRSRRATASRSSASRSSRSNPLARNKVRQYSKGRSFRWSVPPCSGCAAENRTSRARNDPVQRVAAALAESVHPPLDRRVALERRRVVRLAARVDDGGAAGRGMPQCLCSMKLADPVHVVRGVAAREGHPHEVVDRGGVNAASSQSTSSGSPSRSCPRSPPPARDLARRPRRSRERRRLDRQHPGHHQPRRSNGRGRRSPPGSSATARGAAGRPPRWRASSRRSARCRCSPACRWCWCGSAGRA
jgi:hypothetical protein